jgi:hypothetical protein
MTPTEKRFESQVQGVAREKNGGTVDKKMFWDIVVALDQDSESRHRETLQILQQQALENEKIRIATANAVRKELLDYRDSQAERCADAHKTLFETELKTLQSRAPRRVSDPSDLEFGGISLIPEISFSYKLFKWVAMVLVIGALGWALPFWADSCASQNAERSTQHQEILSNQQKIISPSPQANPNNIIAPDNQ